MEDFTAADSSPEPGFLPYCGRSETSWLAPVTALLMAPSLKPLFMVSLDCVGKAQIKVSFQTVKICQDNIVPVMMLTGCYFAS